MSAMILPGNKHIVCITGTVMAGNTIKAPRNLLVREGFMRPVWFTSYQPISDAEYERITESYYQAAKLENRVLADMKFGNGHVGIFTESFEKTLTDSKLGSLIVAQPEIAVQVFHKYPSAKIFAFKMKGMELSKACQEIEGAGNFHRLNLDFSKTGVWSSALAAIKEELRLNQSATR